MKREDLIAQLHPQLQPLAITHAQRAEAAGISIVFTAGFRSPAEQEALFEKGRTLANGVWVTTDPHGIVTNATPDHAPHCRRAAYDLVPIVNEKAAWDRLDLFAQLGAIGKSLGLVWGGDWPKLKDMPHFELAGWRLLPLPLA